MRYLSFSQLLPTASPALFSSSCNILSQLYKNCQRKRSSSTVNFKKPLAEERKIRRSKSANAANIFLCALLLPNSYRERQFYSLYKKGGETAHLGGGPMRNRMGKKNKKKNKKQQKKTVTTAMTRGKQISAFYSHSKHLEFDVIRHLKNDDGFILKREENCA